MQVNIYQLLQWQGPFYTTTQHQNLKKTALIDLAINLCVKKHLRKIKRPKPNCGKCWLLCLPQGGSGSSCQNKLIFLICKELLWTNKRIKRQGQWIDDMNGHFGKVQFQITSAHMEKILNLISAQRDAN